MSAEEQREHAEEAEAVRGLLNRYELGEEAQAFLKTRIGRYIQARSQETMFEAARALTEVSPTDTATIIELQRTYAVASQALTWLAQAIDDGAQAEREAEARHITD